MQKNAGNESPATSPGRRHRNQVYHNFGHLDVVATTRPSSGRPRTTPQPVMKDPLEPPAVDLKRPHTGASQPHINRLNWEKNWLDVRPHSSLERKQEHDEKGRKKEGYTEITRKTSQHFLPVQHPRENTDYKKTVFRNAPSTKPFNSFSKFEDMDLVDIDANEGTYRGGFLTPYERERREYIQAKTKFVAGDFRNFSGVASQIPLRKEGGIRGHGAYPPDLAYHKDKVRDKPFLPVKNLYKYRKPQMTPSNSAHLDSELSI
jgi:hypothetical protein